MQGVVMDFRLAEVDAPETAQWVYDEFSAGPALHEIEEKARNAKAGLWKPPLKDRVEPWHWRREER
jgi:endonuclease YncB( thermonuclease family)